MNLKKTITPLFLVILFFGIFGLAGASEAANWYVRPNGGSYGAENGTNWSNAFDGFSDISWSSVSCGDNIWVAGGTYTQDLIPQKNCTSGSRLNIRRARSDANECTSSSGWSSNFDSTVQQARTGIYFNGNFNYVTISGRTVSGGGSNGWWINYTGATSGPGIEWPNGSNASYNTIEYMDVQGPGNVTYSSDGRGLDLTPFSSATGNTFSHLKIFGWESGIYNVGINNSTFEHIDMYDIMAVNWSSYHPNGIYISGSNNGIIRYSKFHKGPGGNACGEGIFFEQSGGCSNWQIYGNLFYDINATGLKAIEITSSVPNLKIWNNTFDNVGSLLYTQASPGTGSEFRNNLIYASGTGWSWGDSSNNLQISTGNIFVNRTAKDYHIVSTIGANYPRNAGISLSSISKDADGNTFGADGTWDIGAYEYASGTPVDAAAPSVPTGVTATATSSSQINLSWTASTDNVGVIGYIIYRNGTQVATTQNTAYSDTGLSASTLYNYKVAAYDATGNISSQSAQASAITQAIGGTGCTQTLNPGANVASAVSGAATNSVICLNGGNYGNVTLSNIVKSSDVTLKSTTGRTASAAFDISQTNHIKLQSMTISGIYLHNQSKNITVSENNFTGQFLINMGVNGGSNYGNANILIDGNTFDNISVCTNCYEGRLQIISDLPTGVTISNNHFGNAGESDGIQNGSYGTVIGPGNVFDGIRQLNYSRHVDAYQGYGQSHTILTGNYFLNGGSYIMSPDGGDSEQITNNVFIGGDYTPAVQLGSHLNTSFVHNTVKNMNVHIDKKMELTIKSANATVSNNIMLNGGFNTVDSGGVESCTNCTFSYNLFGSSGDARGTNNIIGVPTFIGGASPTSWAGYQLASVSLGKNAGNDGKDMGTNYYGSGTIITPVCGNGTVETGEACDGGTNNGVCPKTCSATCTINSCSTPVCGNGIVETGEACDDGTNNGACPKTCSSACAVNSCSGGSTLGNTTIGGTTDSSNANYINATKFTTGTTAGTISSMSVYVATPISPTPNNQFQLAIYSDSNGNPNSLISQSQSKTITGNTWNTVSISATLSPSTAYWLCYNTNAADSTSNNTKYSSGSAGQTVWRAQTFGSWPTTFGTPAGNSATQTSIYATFGSGEDTKAPVGPTNLTVR